MKSILSEIDMVVVFATYNGGEILRRTLEGYCRQKQPSSSWKILIADNNSTDDTPRIIREFARQIPIEYFTVLEQGKNIALNYIIERIVPYDGVIIFSDDDAIPSEDFLSSWEAAVNKNPHVAMFGGTVRPFFPAAVPNWLKNFEKNFPELYAVNVRPSGMIDAQHIFGPNMAVRGSIFSTGIRFNESIGPNSTDTYYPMGSETEFCVRAAREQDLNSLFVAPAVVFHQIRPHHIERRFIASRAMRHGRGTAMQLAIEKPFYLPANWKINIKLAIMAIGSMLGMSQFYWQYNWLKGFRSGANEKNDKK